MNYGLMETQTRETETAAEIVASCRRLYARNLLAAADGNVSARLNDGRILITPSGVAKAFMNPADMAVMDLDGQILRGHPSSERSMHLEIFRRVPEARAVVHAHPPHAVAFTLARPHLNQLPCDALGEVILGAGEIPIAPYARATTAAMAEALRPYLPRRRAILLARHGAVCWGESLAEAVGGMERVEHAAQMLYLAETLGGATSLPADEIEALKHMRQSMGDKLL